MCPYLFHTLPPKNPYSNLSTEWGPIATTIHCTLVGADSSFLLHIHFDPLALQAFHNVIQFSRLFNKI
jgi:hypothetical protein